MSYACREFRESETKHFGQCFADACDKHLAIWIATIEERSPRKGGAKRVGTAQSQNEWSPKKGKRAKAKAKAGKETKSGKLGIKGKKAKKAAGQAKRATEMKNGVKLCVAWNEGNCTNGDNCPNGKHACNAYTDKNGRVCGMNNHKGKDCTKAISL